MEDFCGETVQIWRLVGLFLLVFKIVIPIILIVLGMIDFGKAVVGSKDDEIKKSAKALGMRVIAAVAIFFVPTLISFIIRVVDQSVDELSKTCAACISSPTGETCDTAYQKKISE